MEGAFRTWDVDHRLRELFDPIINGSIRKKERAINQRFLQIKTELFPICSYTSPTSLGQLQSIYLQKNRDPFQMGIQ